MPGTDIFETGFAVIFATPMFSKYYAGCRRAPLLYHGRHFCEFVRDAARRLLAYAFISMPIGCRRIDCRDADMPAGYRRRAMPH